MKMSLDWPYKIEGRHFILYVKQISYSICKIWIHVTSGSCIIEEIVEITKF